MATNMFVTGIPNGTSLDIQRGTALFLVRKLVKSANIDAEGNAAYDMLRINQLSGCLGITPEEAMEICKRVLQGEVEETVIDEYSSRVQEIKEETVTAISEKLREIKS